MNTGDIIRRLTIRLHEAEAARAFALAHDLRLAIAALREREKVVYIKREATTDQQR
jgi:hypothetical protein